jgi:uroporphyrinogen-III synthase
MHLLVTRPEPEAERTAGLLRDRGHRVTVAPALRVETIAAEFGAGPFAAVLMTSANAARALAAHPRRDALLALPVFTVGARTAETARAAGFADVTSADGDAADLVRLVASKLGAARVLYLAAEERAADITGALAAHGLSVETAAIYRTVANPDLALHLRAAFAEPVDGVLHYSRRSAVAFLAAARSAGVIDAALAAAHYCLSAEVAAPLRAAGATAIRTAAQPDEAAMLEALSLPR